MLSVIFVPLSLLGQPQITDDYINKQISWDEIPIKEIIKCIAPAYGQDSKLIDRVVFEESSYNTIANHDGGQGKGVTGLHKTTFDWWYPKYLKETGENLNYESNLDQLKLMSWAFSKGESYRMAWSTYKKLKV